MTIKATFKINKETKNTLRFQEVEVEGQPLAVGALYIRKDALEAAEMADAQTVEVTIKKEGN